MERVRSLWFSAVRLLMPGRYRRKCQALVREWVTLTQQYPWPRVMPLSEILRMERSTRSLQSGVSPRASIYHRLRQYSCYDQRKAITFGYRCWDVGLGHSLESRISRLLTCPGTCTNTGQSKPKCADRSSQRAEIRPAPNSTPASSASTPSPGKRLSQYTDQELAALQKQIASIAYAQHVALTSASCFGNQGENPNPQSNTTPT